MSPLATLAAAGLVVLAAQTTAARAMTGLLGLDPLFVRVAGAVLVVKLLLALSGLPGRHPHPRLGPANLVTLVRAALVALLAAFIQIGRAHV